jgi:ubiquinone/menaquinone biosynthesis C-methylase UbiE
MYFSRPEQAMAEFARVLRPGGGATVRVSALLTRQPEDVRRRIRLAFDRLAEDHRRGGALEVPIAIKLASARKPDPG